MRKSLDYGSIESNRDSLRNLDTVLSKFSERKILEIELTAATMLLEDHMRQLGITVVKKPLRFSFGAYITRPKEIVVVGFSLPPAIRLYSLAHGFSHYRLGHDSCICSLPLLLRSEYEKEAHFHALSIMTDFLKNGSVE